MTDSEYVLVRRADLATHMTKAPTVYPAWSDAHDRLRAALSADQVEDVARTICARHEHAERFPVCACGGTAARAVLGGESP